MFKQNILIMLLTLLLLCGCGPEDDFGVKPIDDANAIEHVENNDSNEDITDNDSVVKDEAELSTPAGTILIPDEWDQPLNTEVVAGENTAITFLCGDIKLYTVTFSADFADAIGVVDTDNGNCYIGVELFELSEYTDDLASMQESINMVLEQLDLKPVDQLIFPVDESIEIETQYGILNFPGKWKEYLTIETIDDKSVAFYSTLAYHDPVLLFTVSFGEGMGDISTEIHLKDGSVVNVHLFIEELKFDNTWSEEEIDVVYSMQEELNYLLEELQN